MVKSSNLQIKNERVNYQIFFKKIWLYLLFIIKQNLKKASNWIMIAIVFVVSLVGGLMPVFVGPNDMSTFQILILFSLYVSLAGLICIIPIFAIIKGISVFSDSRKNGLELLILSKPISRNQVAISRFSFLFIFNLILSFTALIILGISVSIVQGSVVDYYIRMGLSVENAKIYSEAFMLQNYLNSAGGFSGGVFGIVFFSFLIFSTFAALFSAKFSTKVSYVFSFLIFALNIGAFGAMLGVVNTEILNKPIHSINNSYSNKKELNKFNAELNSTVNKSKYTISYYDGYNASKKFGTVSNIQIGDSSNSYSSNVPFNSSFNYMGEYIGYYQFSFDFTDNSSGSMEKRNILLSEFYNKKYGSDANYRSTDYNNNIYVNYNEMQNIILEMNKSLFNFFQQDKLNQLSGLSVLNYFLPFMSVASLSGTKIESNLNFFKIMPPFNEINLSTAKNIYEYSSYSISSYDANSPSLPYNGIYKTNLVNIPTAYSTDQAQVLEIEYVGSTTPSWAMIIFWGLIVIGLIALYFYLYRKRDFK